MRTETDAKNRLCPFATYAVPVSQPNGLMTGGVAANRPISAALNCVASKCMAWEAKTIKHYGGTIENVGFCRLIEREGEEE